MFFFPFAGVITIAHAPPKKDASSGFATHEKRTRYKRAAKEDLTPPKVKKMKVTEHVSALYKKFVTNGRKLKTQPKGKKKAP